MANYDDIGGHWVTIGGRRVFIPDGKDVVTAMKESGKFGKSYTRKKDKIQDKVDEETKKVKERMTNEVNPFKKEEADVKAVKDRGGLTDEEAKQCVSEAERVYNIASGKEPIITKDIINSVEKVNGKMYGLDFRMKQPSSMAGKIGADAKADGVTFKEAGDGIKDAIRYTAIIDDNNFTSGYGAIKSDLESKGYKESRCKNFYKMYEDKTSCQKAIQCVYEDKEGYKFEFQFHTANSQGAKELNHPLYEEQRKSTTTQARYVELDNQMRNIGSYVKNPKGVLDIKSHN